MNFQIMHIAWRNLFRNPRRTIASLLTVSLGAGGLTIYQGFNNGMTNSYRENRIRVQYAHAQFYPKDYRSRAVEEPWKLWFTNPDEIETKLKEVPKIKEVYPRVTFFSMLQKGGITLAGKGEGVIPNKENKFFDHLNFEEGQALQTSGEIILGLGLAKGLGVKTGDTVALLGQTITGQMNGQDLVVAGVFHTGIKDFDDTMFRIGLTDAQNILNTNRVEYFAVQTTGVGDWDEISKKTNEKLPGYDFVSFDELDEVFYGNAVRFLNSQFQFIRAILLILVGLGIFNMISVGLLERASEVGALRANGEPRRRLMTIFFTENALIGIMGGFMGIIMAWLIVHSLLSGGINMPPAPATTRSLLVKIEMLNDHYIKAVFLSIMTTVLASILPILRLMKKNIPTLLHAN